MVAVGGSEEGVDMVVVTNFLFCVLGLVLPTFSNYQ
jgi:hypothetical protein